MEIKNPIYFIDRKEWRIWLKKNHDKFNEVWLIYYKKHTGKPRIPYEDAVEEALCFGWIDSTVKRIDDERYCQKFTPRNLKSEWSESNKKRVKKLIKEKRMTKFGMEKVKAAKENGKWYQLISHKKEYDIPEELITSLNKNSKAKRFFNLLSPSHKKQFINWIASAKKNETRVRRSNEAIKLLSLNKKMGMK